MGEGKLISSEFLHTQTWEKVCSLQTSFYTYMGEGNLISKNFLNVHGGRSPDLKQVPRHTWEKVI